MTSSIRHEGGISKAEGESAEGSDGSDGNSKKKSGAISPQKFLAQVAAQYSTRPPVRRSNSTGSLDSSDDDLPPKMFSRKSRRRSLRPDNSSQESRSLRSHGESDDGDQRSVTSESDGSRRSAMLVKAKLLKGRDLSPSQKKKKSSRNDRLGRRQDFDSSADDEDHTVYPSYYQDPSILGGSAHTNATSLCPTFYDESSTADRRKAKAHAKARTATTESAHTNATSLCPTFYDESSMAERKKAKSRMAKAGMESAHTNATSLCPTFYDESSMAERKKTNANGKSRMAKSGLEDSPKRKPVSSRANEDEDDLSENRSYYHQGDALGGSGHTNATSLCPTFFNDDELSMATSIKSYATMKSARSTGCASPRNHQVRTPQSPIKPSIVSRPSYHSTDSTAPNSPGSSKTNNTSLFTSPSLETGSQETSEQPPSAETRSSKLVRRPRRGEENSDGDDDDSGRGGHDTEDEYETTGGYRGTFMDVDAQQRAIGRRRAKKNGGRELGSKVNSARDLFEKKANSSRDVFTKQQPASSRDLTSTKTGTPSDAVSSTTTDHIPSRIKASENTSIQMEVIVSGDESNGNPDTKLKRRSRRGEDNDPSHDDGRGGHDTEDEYEASGGYRGTFMDVDAQQRAIGRRRAKKNGGPGRELGSKVNSARDLFEKKANSSRDVFTKQQPASSRDLTSTKTDTPSDAVSSSWTSTDHIPPRIKASENTSIQMEVIVSGDESNGNQDTKLKRRSRRGEDNDPSDDYGRGGHDTEDEYEASGGYRGTFMDVDAQQRANGRRRAKKNGGPGRELGSKVNSARDLFEKRANSSRDAFAKGKAASSRDFNYSKHGVSSTEGDREVHESALKSRATEMNRNHAPLEAIASGDESNGNEEPRTSRRSRRTSNNSDSEEDANGGHDTEDEYEASGGYRGTFMDLGAQQRAIGRRRAKKRGESSRELGSKVNSARDLFEKKANSSRDLFSKGPPSSPRNVPTTNSRTGGDQSSLGASSPSSRPFGVTKALEKKKRFPMESIASGDEASGSDKKEACGNDTEDEYDAGGGYRGTFMNIEAQQRAIARKREKRGARKSDFLKKEGVNAAPPATLVSEKRFEIPPDVVKDKPSRNDTLDLNRSSHSARSSDDEDEPFMGQEARRRGSTGSTDGPYDDRNNGGGGHSSDEEYGDTGFRGCLLDFHAQQRAISRNRARDKNKRTESQRRLQDRMAVFQK